MTRSGRWWILLIGSSLMSTACGSDGARVETQDCCVAPADGGHAADSIVSAADSTLDATPGDAGLDAASVDGAAADAMGQLCRNYASEYTDENGQLTTCSFDTTALRLVCDKSGSKTSYDYPSLRLFIEEAHTVGRVTYTKRFSGSGSTAFLYSYDAQERLAGFDHSSQTTFYQHYDAWDAAGRPTSGMGSYDDTCTGWSVGFSYDDVARTAYQHYSDIGMCPTSAYTFYNLRSYYDGDANLTKREFINMDGELARTENYTIVETTRLCL